MEYNTWFSTNTSYCDTAPSRKTAIRVKYDNDCQAANDNSKI